MLSVAHLRRLLICAIASLSLALTACDDSGTTPEGAGGAGGGGGAAGAGAAGGGGAAGNAGAGGMQTGVGVSDPAARACEVLFTASPSAQVSVSFGDAVTGSWRRREDRVAVAFFHQQDAAIPEGALSIGGVNPQPEVVRCYDRLGAPLAGVELTLQ